MFRSSQTVRVGVLAGGDSAERSISLASGRGVAAALCAAGYQVTCIDPLPDLLAAGARSAVWRADQSVADRQFRPAYWHQIRRQDFDAVFLALHGGAGEDGRLQQYLEERGVAFTGPSSSSARDAMSKAASKHRFRACGVPTPDYRTFDRNTPLEVILAAADALGYPLIVKPDAQGSSLGVVLVGCASELAAGVRQALQFDGQALLEQFIAGREFTVAVIDREPLPLLEVCSAAPVFSYAEKYESAAPHCQLNPSLPAAQQRCIGDAAVAAARALDTRGLVRVDLRLDESGQPWVLELNATPGMTPTSLAPAAARAAGLDMPALCDRLLRDCLLQGTCA